MLKILKLKIEKNIDMNVELKYKMIKKLNQLIIKILMQKNEITIQIIKKLK